MNRRRPPKKQTTRLLKAICTAEAGEGAACGYTVRVTRMWVAAFGPPHCPRHGEMEVEGMDIK